MKNTILQTLFLIFIIYGCTNSDNKIEGFFIHDGGFESCIEMMEDLNYEYYEDTIENFRIKLPRNWWLENTALENIYGITTVDSSLNKNDTRLIAVTVIPGIKTTFKEYISSELRAIKKDTTFLIQKIGRLQIDKLNSFWISYTANDSLKTNGILNYLKDSNTDRIFIVHSVVFGEREIENRLCQLQNLVSTFGLNNE